MTTPQPSQPAQLDARPLDTLIVGARVWTGDPARPRAEVIGLRGDRIAFVGTQSDAQGRRGPQTRVIETRGGTLMPGFIDDHQHLFFGSAELDNLLVEDVHSFAALGEAIGRYAAAHPELPCIGVSHVQYDALPAGGLLTRQQLDALVPDRPLVLMDYSYHTVWANTVALERGGRLHGGVSGPGSLIVRAPDGTASGELREPDAFGPVLALTGAWGRATRAYTHGQAPPDREQREADARTLQRGLANCARLGITSVHNMDGDPYQLELLAQLERDGLLTARVSLPYMMRPDTPLSALNEAAEWPRRFSGDRLRTGRIKLFMDGIIESHTALMLEDYADLPGSCGGALFEAEHFAELAVAADALGLQIGVHAIGDGAVRRTLDGLERARAVNGARDSRHRIEHIELLDPQDLPRFAALGVTASVQPGHVPGAGLVPLEAWTAAVPRAKWGWAFPWRALRESGARVVFGSDWPIIDANPMLGLRAALTRPLWAEDLPDQRPTLDQALAAYTSGPAHAEFMDHAKGMLREGMLADLVLLSHDLHATPPEQFGEVRAELTICGGDVVFES